MFNVHACTLVASDSADEVSGIDAEYDTGIERGLWYLL
jgi:hypothetical protein